MNSKSTTLFFILFALTLSGPQESVNLLKGHIKPLVQDLVDLSLPDAEAVKRVTENINDVLSVELVLEGRDLEDQLAGLFSLDNYIGNKDLAPEQVDSEKIRTAAADILAKMPTFEELEQKDANGEAIKAAALEALSAAGQAWIDVLHNALVFELHSQLKAKSTKYDFVQYEAQTKEFITKSGEKLKAIQQALNQKHKIKMGDEIKNAMVALRTDYVNFYKKYYLAAKNLATYYSDPQGFFRRAILLLVNQAAVDFLEGKFPNAGETPEALRVYTKRITLLVNALAKISLQDENGNLAVVFENIQAFIASPNLSKELQENKGFNDFIDYVAQVVLVGMLPVLPPADVAKYAEETLMMRTDSISGSEGLTQVVEYSFDKNPFRRASKSNADNYRIPKLQNFDALVYLPNKALSDERFRSLIEDFAAISSFDRRRLNLNNKLKGIFATPLVEVKDSNMEFYRFFYNFATECAATVGEEFLDRSAHEIFDHCLDKAPEDEELARDFKRFFLLMKFVNLFFTNPAASYQTAFPKLQQHDVAVQFVLNTMKGDHWLGNRLNFFYQKFSGDQYADSLNSAKVLTLYSEGTYDAKEFASVDVNEEVESRVRDVKGVKGNKIEVNLVKDKTNPAGGSPNKGPEQNQAKVVIDELPKGLITEVVTRPQGGDSIPDPDNLNIGGHSPKPNPRIQIGERQNLVNEVIGRLPKEHLEALKNGSVDDFISNHDVVVTKDGVQTTYVFVKVTRRQSPCHPEKGKKC